MLKNEYRHKQRGITGDKMRLVSKAHQGQARSHYPQYNNCVFDTSTFKFTTEALKKYRSDINFIWDSTEKHAQAIFDNGDTLILSIGGCNHFGFSATLYSSIKFDNVKVLIERAQWLAKTFFDYGFDTKYDQLISEGRFEQRKLFDTLNFKSYEIIDNDTAISNLIYDGFSFEKYGVRTKIEIGGYIN